MKFLYFLPFALLYCLNTSAQDNTGYWHNKERSIHYLPQGEDFVCTNGTHRFNRALYGTNSAFRAEAGDLPEFAMYLPGMGGNLKFGLIAGNQSKWLINANTIKAIYRPGSMLYEIKDSLLGNGTLYLTVLALADAEGMIVQAKFSSTAKPVKLCWVYGGATGKKFSRDGDLGADPESSFYLKPEYCKDNFYQLKGNSFSLQYGSGKVLSEAERYEIQQPGISAAPTGEKQKAKELSGAFPVGATIKTGDATALNTPLDALNSEAKNAPVITGSINAATENLYFLLQNIAASTLPAYTALNNVFSKAEAARKTLAGRIKVNTPDPFINTLGGALGIAADAIWESPSFMHGAIAWRMRLNAWRGPYVADPLGWHDRARSHFSSYAKSQLTSPLSAPVVFDTALHLARQLEKLGTSMFSSGYICRNPNGDFRPHHYDMNLVFIDQLLNHFNYTGDTAYVKEMWPVLERHLDWEKRNFDSDGDGLYDAYAAIWASDALQYSGGGVTHSSAYNYRAFKTASELALLIGKDAKPYAAEANKIFNAMQQNLWLKDKGWFAEYKDLLGLKAVHPSAGLWTVYHTLDANIPNPLQAYQMTRYVDTEIPHIPVKAKGLTGDWHVLSTTNWQPYDWSLNNVVLGENLHTALAYWQANRSESAFKLWKGSLIESMYIGTSPANFQQISFYDAARGELYRDFADEIGMTARTLTEGLFGIVPDALYGKLTVKPGLPAEWNYASLQTPDISFDFKRKGNTDTYTITPSYTTYKPALQLQLNALKDSVASVLVNGKPVAWKILGESVETPVIAIACGKAVKYIVEVIWKGNAFENPVTAASYKGGDRLVIPFNKAAIVTVNDPQSTVRKAIIVGNELNAVVNTTDGNKTLFVRLKQGHFTWWQPVCFTVLKPSNNITKKEPKGSYEKVNLAPYFNDKVTHIFTNQYLSPRPVGTTLQLPTQGIGNWCYPLIMANIDDAGLRKLAGNKDEIMLPTGVPFATPNDSNKNNILFTSQWDNYPNEKTIPLTGKAGWVHLLMAGSTNPMQSRMVNGEVIANYTDGSADTLQLTNPETWWPIEQDYMDDGYAFTTGSTKPLRVHLKTGLITNNFDHYTSIKGFSNRAIDGGAATVLEMPLQPSKQLKSLTLKTLANDVVIGLMGVTLVR